MAFSSPMSEYISTEISILVENGFPVEYTCPLDVSKVSFAQNSEELASARISGLRTINISFSYEFAIADPMESLEEVLEQDLPSLEYAILYMVAKSAHLLKCDFKRQDIKLWANNVSIDSSLPPPYLVSLESKPSDSWRNDESCVHISANNSVCVPMEGRMRAMYHGLEDDAQAVENFINHHIERAMSSETILRNGIEELYLLDRQVDEGVPSIEDRDPSPSEADEPIESSSVALASTLSAGILFIFVILLVAAVSRTSRRRKRDFNCTSRQQDLQDELNDKKASREFGNDGDADNAENYIAFHNAESTSNVIDPDVENSTAGNTASTMTLPVKGHEISSASSVITMHTSNVSNLQSPSTVTKMQNHKAVQRQTEMNASIERSVAGDSADDLLADTSLMVQSSTVFGESGSSARNNVVDAKVSTESTNSNTPILLDALPPKPPGGISTKLPAGASKTIKVNRKKKKRKKQKLLRVNSREQMSEMETISEEKDEEYNSDEDGSDYSCSTDDSSSRPGSREASPTRSEPRSRDASPSNRSKGSASSNALNSSSSSSFDNIQILETIDIPNVSSSNDPESQHLKKRLPSSQA